MGKKGIAPIIFILGIIVTSGLVVGGALYIKNNLSKINNNAQLTPSPTSSNSPYGNCTDDSQCPSGYKCQVIESQGTICPAGTFDPSTGTSSPPKEPCKPTSKVIKGECKLAEGSSCQIDNDCYSGLICHRNICSNQISGGSCTGPDDSSCPDGYKCVQGCGPPVSRVGDKPSGYFCEVEELASKPRNCPICLASNTQILTPSGEVNVKDLRVGMKVYSLDRFGKTMLTDIVKISNTPIPLTHKVIHLILNDGRQLWVSPNHPTINGLTAGQLHVGQRYAGSVISSTELIYYWDNKTYDLLPNSETGFYFANDILMGSTLKQ